MIIEKEYPATHSMSTAWYGIDSEGNVALFDFNENGPVPQGVPEESIESIITNQLTVQREGIKYLNFTSEQAKEVCSFLSPVKPEELKFSVLVKISIESIQLFENLLRTRVSMSEPEDCIEPPICLSRKDGLYIIDSDVFSDTDKKHLLQRGIIEKAGAFEINNDDNWDEKLKKWVFSHQMDGLPFFLYQQPYNSGQLMERAFDPVFPFKESQLNDDERKSAFRFPFSFNDKKFLQIAEYYPSNAMGIPDGNCTKAWLPISETKEADIAYYSMPFFDCGNTCFRCKLSNIQDLSLKKFSPIQSVDNPTIVWIAECNDSIYCLRDYDWVKAKIAFLPIICGYRFNSFDEHCNGNYVEDIVRCIFTHCKHNLESCIDFLNPYVIILSCKTLDFLSEFFTTSDNTISIGTREYEYILTKTLQDKESALQHYASLPYRGIIKSRILQTRKIPEND